MVSFRKVILASSLLSMFIGLAGAQVNNNTLPLSCATNVSVTPSLRSEGYTEQTGDITISCTGGNNIAPGAAIPQVNVQVFLNTAVTSRLLPITGTSNASEALLLIDEPGTNLGGYGTTLSQKVCTTPATGCLEYVGNVVGTTFGTAVDSCSTSSAGVCSTTSTTFGANVFQGLVSGNSVTFFGIPVLPPVTSTAQRVYRITNIRANATSLSGGSAAGATPVIASISISGATSLQITNPTPTVGFVQGGLTAAATSTSFNQCNTQTRSVTSLLSFSENFGTAFKTRVAAQSNTQYAGQTNTPSQNLPGGIYNSESNFVLATPGGGNAGLADFGTRLKAVFNNVPAGARLYVSTRNVNNAAQAFFPLAPDGASSNNTGTTPVGLLVNGESTPDGNISGNSGFFPAITSAGDVPSIGNTPLVEIPVINGSASAIWEVVNTNPNTLETIRFGVYVTYTANIAQNTPPPGTSTVNLSFAPTPTAAFSASAGAAASASLPIPRFIADTAAARNITVINICRTILLYPYVTNISGFDTGLAIANTTTDPFGTGAQAGTCKLNWYQGANNPAQGDTGTIASGTVYTTLASSAVPGFNGYMIAVCNFQFAHGFAFVSDLGARNLAMGYLAIVIADPGTGARGAVPIGGSLTSSGEQGAH